VNTEKLANRLMDLQQMLLDFSDIDRQIYMPDNDHHTDRRENNTEHSYNLAMAAWYLCQHFPSINADKAIRYALAHDLVELHAGDVQAIGRTKEQETNKVAKEAQAAKQLQTEWPDFKSMHESIENYEEQSDPEAIFVKALDKLMPMMLNLLSEGKTWKIYDFKTQPVLDNKDEKTKNSKEIYEIWQVFRKTILAHPELFNTQKLEK